MDQRLEQQNAIRQRKLQRTTYTNLSQKKKNAKPSNAAMPTLRIKISNLARYRLIDIINKICRVLYL